MFGNYVEYGILKFTYQQQIITTCSFLAFHTYLYLLSVDEWLHACMRHNHRFFDAKLNLPVAIRQIIRDMHFILCAMWQKPLTF